MRTMMPVIGVMHHVIRMMLPGIGLMVPIVVQQCHLLLGEQPPLRLE